ncbi:MAG: NfeD family protein [Ghiorsea sp.]
MIDYWHGWLIAGFLILIVELMSGTYFLLAIAGGACMTSLFTWLQQPSFTLQVFAFAVASGLSYVLLSFCRKKKPMLSDGTSHMLGQQAEVIESIGKHGRVRFKGVLWQAESAANFNSGEFVEIIAVHGSTLKVKSIHHTAQGSEQ